MTLVTEDMTNLSSELLSHVVSAERGDALALYISREMGETGLQELTNCLTCLLRIILIHIYIFLFRPPILITHILIRLPLILPFMTQPRERCLQEVALSLLQCGSGSPSLGSSQQIVKSFCPER